MCGGRNLLRHCEGRRRGSVSQARWQSFAKRAEQEQPRRDTHHMCLGPHTVIASRIFRIPVAQTPSASPPELNFPRGAISVECMIPAKRATPLPNRCANQPKQTPCRSRTPCQNQHPTTIHASNPCPSQILQRKPPLRSEAPSQISRTNLPRQNRRAEPDADQKHQPPRSRLSPRIPAGAKLSCRTRSAETRSESPPPTSPTNPSKCLANPPQHNIRNQI